MERNLERRNIQLFFQLTNASIYILFSWVQEATRKGKQSFTRIASAANYKNMTRLDDNSISCIEGYRVWRTSPHLLVFFNGFFFLHVQPIDLGLDRPNGLLSSVQRVEVVGVFEPNDQLALLDALAGFDVI